MVFSGSTDTNTQAMTWLEAQRSLKSLNHAETIPTHVEL